MTLKQVVTRLRQLANSHQQLNHFFIGTADRFLTEDVVYPALFVEMQPGEISHSQRMTIHSFRFVFLDLLDTASNSLENEFEVKSDMLRIAEDYMAMLYDQNFRDWEADIENVPYDIKEYELNDLCAGVSVDVKIGTRFDANLCQVPA